MSRYVSGKRIIALMDAWEGFIKTGRLKSHEIVYGPYLKRKGLSFTVRPHFTSFIFEALFDYDPDRCYIARERSDENCIVSYFSCLSMDEAKELIGRTITKVEAEECQLKFTLDDGKRIEIYGSWHQCGLGVDYKNGNERD